MVRSLGHLTVPLLNATAHIITSRNCLIQEGDKILINSEEGTFTSPTCDNCARGSYVNLAGDLIAGQCNFPHEVYIQQDEEPIQANDNTELVQLELDF